MVENSEKVNLYGTNWTKVSLTYYAPDEVIKIVQNGILIQCLLLFFILWKVSHLRHLLVKPLTTTSLTAGLILLSMFGVFVLSFLFFQWTFIILLLVIELYHRLKDFWHLSESESSMWLVLWNVSFSIVSSDTVAHWVLEIDNKIVHSTGTPVSGKGRLRVTPLNPTIIVARRTYLGEGSLKRRTYKEKDEKLISSFISCQEHAVAIALTLARYPIETLLLSFAQLRWRTMILFIAVLVIILMMKGEADPVAILKLFNVFLYEEISRAVIFLIMDDN